ncbi:MAG TPA: YigZ family protein [Thermoanaerobaculia bacterium]|nr:YigZ family protein [Thermoanaerobaculia bacterium]
MPSYEIPGGSAEAEIREKGSVFLALVRPVASEPEARSALDEVARRFPDASHRCWALRLGSPPRERASDAGEPAGTAGKPMLQVLRGAALSDVLAVAVRWFGGVKLGKGGLARAYASAVRAALVDLPRSVRASRVRIAVEVPYDKIGAVKRLIQPPAVALEAEEYGERVRLDLAVLEERVGPLLEALADLGVTPAVA